MYTATCEFTKYDNPLLVSAGEEMFLNPHGGCVALFTCCRPTYGHYNQRQTLSLLPALTQRDEQGKPLRYGDIICKAKSDALNFYNHALDSNLNIRFVFLDRDR